jgi:hypothetical protein
MILGAKLAQRTCPVPGPNAAAAVWRRFKLRGPALTGTCVDSDTGSGVTESSQHGVGAQGNAQGSVIIGQPQAIWKGLDGPQALCTCAAARRGHGTSRRWARASSPAQATGRRLRSRQLLFAAAEHRDKAGCDNACSLIRVYEVGIRATAFA